MKYMRSRSKAKTSHWLFFQDLYSRFFYRNIYATVNGRNWELRVITKHFSKYS